MFSKNLEHFNFMHDSVIKGGFRILNQVTNLSVDEKCDNIFWEARDKIVTIKIK